MEQDDAKETRASQGSKDAPCRIRRKQKKRRGFNHPYCDRGTGFTLGQIRYQPQRTSRKIRQRDDQPTGGEIVGGTLSQLVADCREQIAGNEKIIGELQDVNQTLRERIDFYQRLMEKIYESQE